MLFRTVGRCKLDPSLKASRFQTLIVKSPNSAFNLNPGLCESVRPPYSTGEGRVYQSVSRDAGVTWTKAVR